MARVPEISWKMLHAFLTWPESDTQDEAARKLGISQPALHRKIEKFQVQIGSGPRLMQHGRSGWELTDEGRAILPVIRDLVRRFEQLEQHLSHREVAPRAIRIGTGSFAAQYILPAALAAVRQRLPDCRLETRLTRRLDRILFTADARLDLAIVTHSPERVETLVRRHFQTRRRIVECELLAQSCRAGSTGLLADRWRKSVAGGTGPAFLRPSNENTRADVPNGTSARVSQRRGWDLNPR